MGGGFPGGDPRETEITGGHLYLYSYFSKFISSIFLRHSLSRLYQIELSSGKKNPKLLVLGNPLNIPSPDSHQDEDASDTVIAVWCHRVPSDLCPVPIKKCYCQEKQAPYFTMPQRIEDIKVLFFY